MEYDRRPDESTTEALHRATRRCSICEECDFDPIYSVVDPDALDALFDSCDHPNSPLAHWTTFVRENCAITVDADGVRIEPRN